MSLQSRKTGRQRVVITGASAGVGRATALFFARRGWAVAGLARARKGLQGARRDIEAAGGHALILPVEVGDPEAINCAAEAVIAAWGGIDVWVSQRDGHDLRPCARDHAGGVQARYRSHLPRPGAWDSRSLSAHASPRLVPIVQVGRYQGIF
jgi:NADPH:quinone reductase-like Zn-dependent oxidoreductase